MESPSVSPTDRLRRDWEVLTGDVDLVRVRDLSGPDMGPTRPDRDGAGNVTRLGPRSEPSVNTQGDEVRGRRGWIRVYSPE